MKRTADAALTPARAAYDAVIAYPRMRIGVRTAGGAITEITFLSPATRLAAPRTGLAQRAVRQLRRYATDPDFAFGLPLAPAGTPFQRRVWRAIRAIPRGGVRSYGELARALGSAPRAVGQACGANPYPLVVPCHRVVAAHGLGGFAHHAGGFQLEAKRWLLGHEGCPIARRR